MMVREQKKRVAQLLLAWLAVTAVIFTTGACSKNDGGDSPAPPAPPEAPAAPAPAVPAGPAPAEQSALPGSELDKDKGESSSTLTQVEDVEDEVTMAFKEQPTTVYDPSELSPDEIFAMSSRPVPSIVTEGSQSLLKNGDGARLYFSGSGQDELRLQIRDQLNSMKSKAKALANKEFAQLIEFASLDVDWNTRRATVHLVLTRNKVREKIGFIGSLDNKLRMRLKSPRLMELEVACMDDGGGCQTAYLRVLDTSTYPSRMAHIITRSTDAKVQVEGNETGSSNNPEYDRLLNLLTTVETGAQEVETVRNVQLHTFEVLGGKSQFRVDFKFTNGVGDDDTLAWAGPLVKPKGSDQVNLEVRTLQSRRGDLTLGRSIRDMRLVRNDGRGNIQLEMTVRKFTEKASEDRLLLTVARIHKPVKDLGIPVW